MTISIEIRKYIKILIKTKFKDTTFAKNELDNIITTIYKSINEKFNDVKIEDISKYLKRHFNFINEELIVLTTKRNEFNEEEKNIKFEINDKINQKVKEIENKENKKQLDEDDELNDDEKRREKIVIKLKNIKYNDQRTPEWFKQRDKMITASDAGAVVNVNEHEPQYSLIIKKTERKPFLTNEFCYHGKKFEKIALKIYEKRNNVHVADFGLVEHEKYSFIGASPDGIVDFKFDGIHKTKLVGRMIEIKCPLIRRVKKDGVDNVPNYYKAQVQLQLETCDLDECDFWQCDISEYLCRNDFIEDTDETGLKSRETGEEKGVMMELVPDKKNYTIYDDAFFIHPDKIDMTLDECDKWILETIDKIKTKYSGYLLGKVIYWRLNEFSKVLIERDKKWFLDNLNEIEKMWNYILFMRINPDKYKIFNNYVQSLKFKNNKKIMEVLSKIYNVNDENYTDNLANIINETNKNIKKKNTIEKKIETNDVNEYSGFIVY